jgi:hypothetical protein
MLRLVSLVAALLALGARDSSDVLDAQLQRNEVSFRFHRRP